MSRLENKIEAKDRTIVEVLDKNKYTVDYYQREYSWQQKHIEQLVTDLTTAFLNEYEPRHERTEVENYNSYYLGPFVLSEKGGKRSIIDGQQRLTSLTLILIFLNHLQKDYGVNEAIEGMIFSEKFGKKSFNIDVPERTSGLQALFETGEYNVPDDADASTVNMVERYNDIIEAFPKEIDAQVLPFFIDWFKERVVLVEILAYSDDNAYTIFETMNDRGLNLTPTEMLKGYLLSRFKDNALRKSTNDFWKKAIIRLQGIDKEEDQKFIQAFLRAKYAVTIRQGKAGSKNEDFEKIGTRFHNWFRDNLKLVGLGKDSQEDFDRFINKDFKYYFDAYLRIAQARATLTKGLESVHYIEHWGIAASLRDPLLLAPLLPSDSVETANQKINLVAKYIEIFCVRRSINFRTFAATSIRYTIYTLVKELRDKNLEELQEILESKLAAMDESWVGMHRFRLHGQNKVFVKYLLSRLSGYVDQIAGQSTDFRNYFLKGTGKPYEIEHIWSRHFDDHRNEFEHENDFVEYRNRLGGLVLLPRGTNQSYGDKPYEVKKQHYIKENLLVKSLCPLTYENNPNFKKLIIEHGLPFKAHNEFKKGDFDDRQDLYQVMCEKIWTL
ncbi:MAG: DUF262 domain-containing protein [Atribacterota bacterium]|jgi:uncharacterized protein with ParB-like and HNH nuclease domain|nr:DUF262 domain-containing protein [Atribacterota bacterium]